MLCIGLTPTQAMMIDIARPEPAPIVFGEGLEREAAALKAACGQATNVAHPTVPAANAMAPGTWRLAASWLRRDLILLGNVVNNEAIFALYSQYLAGVNAAYPGPGHYVLRSLHQPFRRGADMLVIGGSDRAGVAAGVERVAQLLAANDGRFPPTIEIGDAGGPDTVPAKKRTTFTSAVYRFYWDADMAAGREAKRLLLTQVDRRDKGLWGFDKAGHYQWERNYRPLRQLLASGLLSPGEQERVDARLTTNVLENSDWAFLACLNKHPRTFMDSMSRHVLSALTGGHIVLDYLHHIGAPPAGKRAGVKRNYELTLAHYRHLLENGHFHSNVLAGTEGAESINILADLYLHHGDRRFVTDGILRRMADYNIAAKDNLGWYAGGDSYITCRPGCHFARSAGGAAWLLAGFFYGDGAYRWLLENQHTFLTHFQVARPPKTTAILDHIPAVDPTRLHGLTVHPLDPWCVRKCATSENAEVTMPVKATAGQLFSRAAFRERFDPDAAYLLVQGLDTGSINANYSFQANGITRYTELGSLLLFSNSMKHTGWAQNVVSASRGKPDPRSAACVLGAWVSSDLVSGMQSRQECSGGTRWVRTIVRRSARYTAVLDKLTAHEEDTYSFTCRWRSFHAGRKTGPALFEAIDGLNQVRFRIQSAVPATWQVETLARDGAARPTTIRQIQRRHLNAGASVAFQNLLYASDAEHPRTFAALSLGANRVLVHGRAESGEELAAMGVGDLALADAHSDAAFWYGSRDALVLAGARAAQLGVTCRLESDEPFNLELRHATGRGWLSNPGDRALQLSISAKTPDALRVNGNAASSTELEPGRHRIKLKETDALFAAMARELRSLRGRGAAPTDRPAPALEMKGARRFDTVWEQDGLPAPYAEHSNVRIWAEPECDIGEPATWRNRLVGPPSGYGWHGSERAGWSKDVNGAIVMDLGSEISIADIQLIRSRRYRTEAGAFNPGEFVFDIVLSNDGFQREVRKLRIDDPHYRVHHAEMMHYTHTRRLPMFTVPLNRTARFVKIIPRRVIEVKSPPKNYYGTYRDAEISFMEIHVHRTDREPRREARLWPVPGRQGGVLHQAGTQLQMLASDGAIRWQRQLDAGPAAITQLADMDGDGVLEALVFTLEETLAAYNTVTGKPTFEFDVNASPNTPNRAEATHSRWRPNAFAAWRPNAAGQLEIAFFPHYAYGRISPGPNRAFNEVVYPSHLRSAKFAFRVPDVTGDGREELAVVGVYGRAFGVIGSDAPIERGTLPGYVATAPLTGYSSGNMELTLYWDGAVVRNGAGDWIGTVSLNPGGIDYYAGPTFEPKWSHFHHPENRCFTQADLDGDGTPELLVGRVDGCVLAYAAADGKLVGRTMLDGTIRCLGTSASGVIAGTEQSLILLDRTLTPLARRPGGVEALAVLPRQARSELVVAALSNGRVVGLAPGR